MNLGLHPRSAFYIIECSYQRIRAVSLRYFNNQIHFKKFFESDFKDLGALLKELSPGKESKILFLHDPSLAATFAASVRLAKNGEDPISRADFESFLRAATKQFWGRFREEARRKLFADEVNVVLANNRFLNFRLDGRSVVNPVGLRGRFAELEVEQTYLLRQFLDALEGRSFRVRNLFHIEIPGALSDVIRRLYGKSRVLLALVSEDKTRLFAVGDSPRYFGAVSFPKVGERGDFLWGSRNILRAIGARWGVSEAAAKKLVRMYSEGAMSKHAERAFEKAIEAETSEFRREVARRSKKEDFVSVVAPVPFLRPGAHSGIHYKIMSTPELIRGFDFEVSMPASFKEAELSPIFLSGLIAYLNRTSDNYLNILAREKAEWLMPPNSA